MRKHPKRNSQAKIPPEMHERVAEWCAKPNDTDENGKPIPRTGGLAYAMAQCAADGLKVSLDTVSRFYAWWQLQQDLDASFEVEKQVLANSGNAKLAREAGEALLIRRGIALQDPDMIKTAAQIADSRRHLDLEEKSGKTKADIARAKLAQKDRDHALAVEKLVIAGCEKIMKAARDPKVREIVEDTKLSSAEKIAAIRKAYFADVDATKVELPE
jgi:hypothetical protein